MKYRETVWSGPLKLSLILIGILPDYYKIIDTFILQVFVTGGDDLEEFKRQVNFIMFTIYHFISVQPLCANIIVYVFSSKLYKSLENLFRFLLECSHLKKPLFMLYQIRKCFCNLDKVAIKKSLFHLTHMQCTGWI